MSGLWDALKNKKPLTPRLGKKNSHDCKMAVAQPYQSNQPLLFASWPTPGNMKPTPMPSPRLLVIEGNSPQTLADHVAVGGTAASKGYSDLLRELVPGAEVDICYPGDPGALL